MKRFLVQAARAAKVDLEALEFGLRAVMLAAGARALEALVAGVGSGRRGEPALCSCGRQMESRGQEPKRIRTIRARSGIGGAGMSARTAGRAGFQGTRRWTWWGRVFRRGCAG